MKLTKHIGIDKTANLRVILVYALLPESQTETLVTHIDRLPERIKEQILSLLTTPEAQHATNFADVLGRHMYSDSGKSVVQVLHEHNFLKKLSIREVDMTPTPSIPPLPLEFVLIESGILARPAPLDEKFNPHQFNAEVAKFGEASGVAQNLLSEATLLEQEAARKREQAYRHAPSLRPKTAAPVIDPLSTAAPVIDPLTAASPILEPVTTTVAGMDDFNFTKLI